MNLNIPYLETDNKLLNDAYRIAAGDIVGNIVYYQNGLLTEEKPCMIAGLDYNTPWTRDTAINIWNALSILSPEVSKNTLLAVLEEEEGNIYIGGQYWDSIIWMIGAREYCRFHKDDNFYRLAFEAGRNSVHRLEEDEFDEEDGLFRGPAVYGDGIAAYPDKYSKCPNQGSGILEWVDYPGNPVYPKGYGIPMKALSTNCVYFKAYEILAEMAHALGEPAKEFEEKAAAMKKAVNKNFWNEKRGSYDYLAGECDCEEGLGLAFAVLFGIADERQTALIRENTHICAHGIPCVWPTFWRYECLGGYGRHSGTIWPHIQGFWARAMHRAGYQESFEKELYLMAQKAVRDMHFSEIYHPDTGALYGGMQEQGPGGIVEWDSRRKQTWSATAFLSLIYFEILGLTMEDGEPVFHSQLPINCGHMRIRGFEVAGWLFDLDIDGKEVSVRKRRIS